MKKYAAPVMAAILAVSMTVPAMAEGYSLSINASNGVTTETVKTVTSAKMTETASPTSSKIYVNGALTDFDAYNIKGNNYFKLRDVAYALSGTENQFNVIWDAEAGEIKLVSGEAYAKVGGLKKGSGAKKTATLNTAPIMKDSKYVTMTAYTIDGNNYFKLRDLGDQFGFTVGWNALSNAVTMETDGYTPDLTAGAGGNGTVYQEGAKHSVPKEGDTIIKADGTKVVLKSTKLGDSNILGYGQGVDFVTGTTINGHTKTGNRLGIAWKGYGDQGAWVKDPQSGEVHLENEWMSIMSNNLPSYNGKKDGETAGLRDGKLKGDYYAWDGLRGTWYWIGPAGM